MKPGAELDLQMLNRAYCYLRLSGVDAASALEGLRTSLEVLGQGGEVVWSRLQAVRWSVASGVEGRSPPPLLRGHMRYPPEDR